MHSANTHDDELTNTFTQNNTKSLRKPDVAI